MRAVLGLACLLVCTIGSLPALGAEEREVTGCVLDAAGEPVAGVEVATYWTATAGRWSARQAVTTDAEGRFALTVRWQKRARSVMALDGAQERGCVALLDEETSKEPLTLKLGRTTRLVAAFESTGLGRAPEKVYVSFTARPALIAVGSYVGAPSLSLRVPPGDYHLSVKGVDCIRVRKRVATTSDMQAVELGTTDLEPTVIARHYGKEPPAWHVTDARGVEKTVQLADFKGRWVLLEFWGHW